MFFQSFPSSTFQFDGKSYTIEDLTRKVIFEPNSFSNYSYLYDIDIGDTRPDIVAQQIYGNVNYWWVFFVVNNITMNEWPLTDAEFDDMISEKYTDFQLNQTYRYVDDDGNQVPSYGFPTFVADGSIVNYAFQREDFLNPNLKMTKSNRNKQTLRDFLEQQNEDRKKIKTVRAEFVGEFFDDFRNRIKNEVDLG